MSRFYDVVIVGGGASGLCAANVIKMHDREISVCVLEKLSRVGKKLAVTGNGRCNITNRKIDISRYHGENVGFAKYALKNYDNFVSEVFFNELGLVFTYDSEGKAYPYSLQAASVVDALRFSASQKGVDVFCDTAVKQIEKSADAYKVVTDGDTYKCTALVCAAGLYSGGDSTGSDGSVLAILKKMGYKTVNTTPAIVQIKTENEITRQLKGIKVNAKVTLTEDGNEVRSETGEVLFCDYGLSGPPVMQVSRAVERGKGKFGIELDLMPEYSFTSVYDMIRYRTSVLLGRNADEFFTGMLNKRVGQTVLKTAGIKLSDSVDTFTEEDIKRVASVIKKFTFNVTGTTGFGNSQVTAGGLDTSAFDDETMMSERDRGLFCIGEILDIDGDCGGFNLQWAWSSAMCAADGICDYLTEK